VSEYMTTMALGEPSRHYIEDALAARKQEGLEEVDGV